MLDCIIDNCNGDETNPVPAVAPTELIDFLQVGRDSTSHCSAYTGSDWGHESLCTMVTMYIVMDHMHCAHIISDQDMFVLRTCKCIARNT